MALLLASMAIIGYDDYSYRLAKVQDVITLADVIGSNSTGALNNRPITHPAAITQGMLSHNLLPCCAASRPITPEIAIAAKLIGSRQFENGGTNTLPSRSGEDSWPHCRRTNNEGCSSR